MKNFGWIVKILAIILLCFNQNNLKTRFLLVFCKYKKKYLSYARLGKFMLSNNINKYMNPIKIPLTFGMLS